jgi:hypothetical protein
LILARTWIELIAWAIRLDGHDCASWSAGPALSPTKAS